MTTLGKSNKEKAYNLFNQNLLLIMKTEIVYSFNFVHVKLDYFNGKPRYFIELLDDSLKIFDDLLSAQSYAECYADFLETC